MSISIADASATTLPSAAGATTAPALARGGGEMLFFWICIAWAIVGLLAAKGLRAFRRQSIVGPVRIDTVEEAAYLFFIGLFAYFMAILAGSFFARFSTLSDDLKQQMLQVVVFVTLGLGIIVILAIAQPQSLKRMGLHPGWIANGLIGGAATLFIVYPLIQVTGDLVLMLQDLLHKPLPQAHELLLFLEKSHNPWWRILGVFSAVVVAPVTEELLFRGVVQTTLGRVFAFAGERAAMPVLPIPEESSVLQYRSIPPTAVPLNPGPGARWAAVIVTAALFAAIHDSIPFFPPLFVLAIALGYIYERTGNLWMNIATHSLFNAGQILLFMTQAR